jgi:hypothetical protein
VTVADLGRYIPLTVAGLGTRQSNATASASVTVAKRIISETLAFDIRFATMSKEKARGCEEANGNILQQRI